MNDGAYIQIMISFMVDTVILAGIPLAAATVVGLVISIFQAVTQIQDQTLSQTAKIASIILVLMTFGAALTAPLMNSTNKIFSDFSTVVR